MMCFVVCCSVLFMQKETKSVWLDIGLLDVLSSRIYIKHQELCGVKGKPFKCPEEGCTAGFRSKNTLQTHLKTKHSAQGVVKPLWSSLFLQGCLEATYAGKTPR